MLRNGVSKDGKTYKDELKDEAAAKKVKEANL